MHIFYLYFSVEVLYKLINIGMLNWLLCGHINYKEHIFISSLQILSLFDNLLVNSQLT